MKSKFNGKLVHCAILQHIKWIQKKKTDKKEGLNPMAIRYIQKRLQYIQNEEGHMHLFASSQNSDKIISILFSQNMKCFFGAS